MVDKQLFTFRAPVGVAAIVTAGNFPRGVPSWYIVPALVAENAVVWKPAEYTPVTARGILSAAAACGVACGRVLDGLADGPSTFTGLEQAPQWGLVDKIGFTGSTEVGRRIGELAGRHLQTPCLELGGKNLLVVMPDADLDLAVEPCSAGSAPPGNGAPRSARPSCTLMCTTTSSTASRRPCRRLRSATHRGRGSAGP